MARLDGKVVFITGAARGQGRSHAVEMAKEGASIIAIDICEQIPTVFYPMSTKDDLDETVRQVEAAGGRIVARVADVRDRESLKAALADGVAEFGRVDALIANAGIMPLINEGADDRAWFDGIDVLLTGVWHSIEATLPYLLEQGQGGSIVITGSTSGNSGAGINRLPGMVSYSACKAGVVGLMRIYASKLTQDMIRVNVVHPTGVNTPMVVNNEHKSYTEQFPEIANDPMIKNPMPVDLVEPIDVTNAMIYLVSDEARYVTGSQLAVDAGFFNR